MHSITESCHHSKVATFGTIVPVQRPIPKLHRSAEQMDTLLFVKKSLQHRTWNVSTQNFLAATKPSPTPILVHQTILPCFTCLLIPRWLKGSNHQKNKVLTGEATAALQDCFTDWKNRSWRIYINSDILHQQMCWWWGDHKHNKITFQPESLDERRGEGPIQSQSWIFVRWWGSIQHS